MKCELLFDAVRMSYWHWLPLLCSPCSRTAWCCRAAPPSFKHSQPCPTPHQAYRGPCPHRPAHTHYTAREPSSFVSCDAAPSNGVGPVVNFELENALHSLKLLGSMTHVVCSVFVFCYCRDLYVLERLIRCNCFASVLFCLSFCTAYLVDLQELLSLRHLSVNTCTMYTTGIGLRLLACWWISAFRCVVMFCLFVHHY